MTRLRTNRWLPPVLSTTAAFALWTLAAVRGYAWQTLWLPAAVAGAAWPRERQTTPVECVRRFRDADRGFKSS